MDRKELSRQTKAQLVDRLMKAGEVYLEQRKEIERLRAQLEARRAPTRHVELPPHMAKAKAEAMRTGKCVRAH